jgi:hypothetical protein
LRWVEQHQDATRTGVRVDLAHSGNLRDIQLKPLGQLRAVVETGNQNSHSAGRGGENLESALRTERQLVA